ncbi:hypothetical protein APUTEX25_001017, partial [Auxenochlorella protothecoides]
TGLRCARALPPDAGSDTGPNPGWQTFWTTLDVTAWLGTVGSALAFIITGEMMLTAAPVLLPILALYASRQRERLAIQATQASTAAALVSVLREQAERTAQDNAALAAEMRGSGSGVQAALKLVEAKLSTIEASVLSTAATGKLGARLSRQLEGLAGEVGRLRGAGSSAAAEDVAGLQSALRSLEARLQETQSSGQEQLSSEIAGLLAAKQQEMQWFFTDKLWKEADQLKALLASQAATGVRGASAAPGADTAGLLDALGAEVREALRQVRQEEAQQDETAHDATQTSSGKRSGGGVAAARAPDRDPEASRFEPLKTDAPVAASTGKSPSLIKATYDLGLQRLKAGRILASTPGADLGLADSAFWEAAAAFQEVLQDAPGDLRATGNLGNVLQAHGRLKMQIWRSVSRTRAAGGAPGEADRGAVLAEAAARLAAEAGDMLVLAGRRYREVLQADPGDARAFLNWGRCICLRGELAREAGGSLEEAAALFQNAADKFDAALDAEGQTAVVLQHAGAALTDAADALLTLDRAQARALAQDALPYLRQALALDPRNVDAQGRLTQVRAILDST